MVLFKHNLVSNDHLSLHLPPFLEDFGPVHGWWAFAFERYNGVLGRLNKNNHISMYLIFLGTRTALTIACACVDELPATFMRYFCIGASLRGLMSSSDWAGPDGESLYLQDMLHAYRARFGDTLKGKHLSDMELFDSQSSQEYEYEENKEQRLDRSVYDRLLSLVNLNSERKFCSYFAPSHSSTVLLDRVHYVRSVVHGSVRYAQFNGKTGNSFIIYDDPLAARASVGNSRMIGRIVNVIMHRRMCGDEIIVEPFLVVRNYKQLTEADQAQDPYRLIAPNIDVFLCYNELENDDHLIRLGDVHAHFAAYVYTPGQIGRECIVVRSLSRE